MVIRLTILPGRELFLKVDSAAAVNSGTVSPKNAGKIVKEIHWKVTRGSYLYRNDVMLFDLIAHNNWKRPICFVNPYSVNKVFNVSKYCHMRGLVYQFTPVPAMDYVKGLGGVAPDSSYRILMNKNVRWGRLNIPGVLVDPVSYRNAIFAKRSYVRLAQALANLHKYDSTVKVLDKGIYFFPNSKFPFDYSTIQWAYLYYQSGAIKKGNKVIMGIYNRYMGDLRYYNSLNERFIPYYKNNIREALSALQQMSRLTSGFRQDKLSEKIKQGFNDQLKLMEETMK